MSRTCAGSLPASLPFSKQFPARSQTGRLLRGRRAWGLLRPVDRDNPAVNKGSIAHRLHPGHCHTDSLPWASGPEQCTQRESILIKDFKISASVISLKTHNLSEGEMTTVLFTETTQPQSPGLRGAAQAGGGGGKGQDVPSARGKPWQAASYSSQETREDYSATLHPAMVPPWSLPG